MHFLAVKACTSVLFVLLGVLISSDGIQAAPKLKPAPKPAAYPIKGVAHRPPLCKALIGPGKQCGGTLRGKTGCNKYPFDLKLCQDAPYQKACCTGGRSCQRGPKGATDWKCRGLPSKAEPLPPFPALSALPPNSSLPKPIILRSKVKWNNHLYILIKYETTWDIASAICQYYFGAHLASVHDIDDMWRINNQCYLRMENMCWVGAHDRLRRGVFQWSDGKSWDFAFWQQNGGVMSTPDARCIALQDGFQTWPCDEKFAIACQKY